MMTANTQAAKGAYVYNTDLIETVLDATELIQQHRNEIEQHDAGTFCPDRAFYVSMQEHGRLLTFTVTHDTDLVGYCVLIVQPSHQSAGAMHGIVDTIYVHPSHRGTTSIKLIDYVGERSQSFGVTDVFHFVPTYGRNWSKVLERLGYTQIEHVYHKGL